MIDITTVQTFDVPPKISELQAENGSLTKKNKVLKYALFGFGLSGYVFWGISYLQMSRKICIITEKTSKETSAT